MAQRGEVVEREVFSRRDVKVLLQLAEQLGLLDAVDSQVGLQVGIELHDLGWIAGLLDDEVHEERFELFSILSRSGRCSCLCLGGWSRGGGLSRETGQRCDHISWLAMAVGHYRRSRSGSRGLRGWRFALDRHAAQVIHHMSQCGEVIEREVFRRGDVEVFLQLAEQLGLLDAVDSQVGLQIGIKLDNLGWIAGLLDDEADEEGFQLGRIEIGLGRRWHWRCGSLRGRCRRWDAGNLDLIAGDSRGSDPARR